LKHGAFPFAAVIIPGGLASPRYLAFARAPLDARNNEAGDVRCDYW